MRDVSYLRDIPDDEIVFELPKVIGGRNTGFAVMTQRVWDALDAYEGTLPTSPSAGRVYRRGQWLKVVIDATDDRGGQLHVPCEVTFADEGR